MTQKRFHKASWFSSYFTEKTHSTQHYSKRIRAGSVRVSFALFLKNANTVRWMH